MHGLDFDAREQQHNAGEKGNGAKAMDCGPIARMARTTLDGNRCAQNFGLLGMQERVRQLHGGIAFDSAPRDGFRIDVRLPIGAVKAKDGRD